MFGNERVEKFLNQIFSVNMSGTINLIESTKVTQNTATAIDHIMANTVVET